ncbi:MAG: preprotein translocase subunit SecE [Bacillota bacterium]
MSTQTNTNNLGKTAEWGKFFKGVRAELKKVNWPNRKDLTSYTVLVLVSCTLAAIGLWLADTIFGKALQLIIK